MSGWNPRDGRQDELSFGTEDTGSSSDRQRLVLAGVCLLVGLLVGLVLGARGDLGNLAGDASASGTSGSSTEVVAGEVESSTEESSERGPEFTLQVLNDGSRTLTVVGLGFDQFPIEVETAGEVSIPPEESRLVRFTAPPDCFFESPDELTSVRFRLRSEAGESTQKVPLPGGGAPLVHYESAMCDTRPVSRVEDLVGVWIMEESFGLFSAGQGVHLMRFERDGTFTADPEGELLLLHEARGVEGRFSLRHGELVVHVEDGYACSRGDRAVWRAGLLDQWVPSITDEPPRLALAWQSGRCPDDGWKQVWVMRRVLDGIG